MSGPGSNHEAGDPTLCLAQAYDREPEVYVSQAFVDVSWIAIIAAFHFVLVLLGQF